MRLRAAKGPIQAYYHTEHFPTFLHPGCLLGKRAAGSLCRGRTLVEVFVLGITQGGCEGMISGTVLCFIVDSKHKNVYG